MKKIIVFGSIDPNEPNSFFKMSEFKEFIEKEFSGDYEFHFYQHDFSETSIRLIKEKSKSCTCLIFIITNSSDKMFFFNLGMGTGYSIAKEKPVLFVSIDDVHHSFCDYSGFFIFLRDLRTEPYRQLVKNYLIDNIEDFWISYTHLVISDLNKNLGLELKILDSPRISEKLGIIDHPNLIPKSQIDNFVLVNFTENYKEHTDKIIKYKFPDAYYEQKTQESTNKKATDETKKQRKSKFVIKNYGNLTISDSINKVKYNSTLGISKADFEALQEQIQNLEMTQQAMLKAFLEELPEPETDAEKETFGDKIINFINEHSLPITQNLVASGMYDALKFMFAG